MCEIVLSMILMKTWVEKFVCSELCCLCWFKFWRTLEFSIFDPAVNLSSDGTTTLSGLVRSEVILFQLLVDASLYDLLISVDVFMPSQGSCQKPAEVCLFNEVRWRCVSQFLNKQRTHTVTWKFGFVAVLHPPHPRQAPHVNSFLFVTIIFSLASL